MEYCTIRVAKTKALISFAATVKLICVFVFAYADCWFSHDPAHIIFFHKFIMVHLLSSFVEKKHDYNIH